MRDHEMYLELRDHVRQVRGDYVDRSPGYNEEEKSRWDRIEELMSRMYKRLCVERDMDK